MTQSPTAPAERAHKAAKRYIYAFGGGQAEGDATMRDLLGGKGAGLAEMTNAGLPVPPGFTITTEACNDYFAAGEKLPDGLWEDVLSVDPSKIQALIESRRLPPDVEDAVLASREEVRTQHALWLKEPSRSRR